MNTLELVKIAFRKLKASVYFDKTILPLRDAVVEFETSGDFEDKLAKIAQAYDNTDFGENTPMMSEILASISAMPFPKKTYKKVENEKDVVISVGNPKEKPIIEVDQLQHYIEMNVYGHIIGILWIMVFGKQLDGCCYKNAFGNRLREKLIWNNENDEIKPSPALFEPYFAQYSLWRDGGLSCAEDLLAKKHDVMILTLDLKKYYYNAGITKETFGKILDNGSHPKNEALHNAVFAIIEKYSEKLRESGVSCNENALPIGFLPSSVLSNWCLAKFDQGILDFWNPSYYGRYVDDIIIVEKIEKGSKIYKKARDGELTKDFVIHYYLGDGRRKGTPSFVEQNLSNDMCNVPDATVDTDALIKGKNGYRVNTEFCLSDHSTLEFQSDKTRIIALFPENNSTALISKFKQEIFENVSEFRLMPEVGAAFMQDDFSQFYRLDNDATINKLRGVKGISMNKYELSKFLGKYRVVSSLVDDGTIKKFTRIIGKMFNDRELIENYILWERVLEIFITDKDYDGFIKFVKRIKSAIDSLSVIERTSNDEENEVNPSITQRSLKRHLTATLNRVLSLLWGKNACRIVTTIGDLEPQISLRKEYVKTRMSNKYVMAVPNEVIVAPDGDGDSNGDDLNFTDFAASFNYICNNECGNDTHEFLPYFRQAQDIAVAMLLKSICPSVPQSSEPNSLTPKSYIDEVSHDVSDVPIEILPTELLEGYDIVSVKGPIRDKLRVAIANVNVAKVSDLDNVLKGRKPNRKYERYRALADLVNIAIKEKAEMLVLPENYVPFEWLPALATKAAREGLAIVAGIEHVVVRDFVYNYTAVLLPFRYFKSIPTAAVFFQLKRHYAPEERRIIEGYRAKPIVEQGKRPLYHWSDCYFPVYCCYELVSITDRAEFMSWADMVVAVEYNKDIHYFSNIVESLARDLHCYFVQVNTSQYGDSRITQPTRSEERNLITVKGGLNQSLLIGEIDVQALREFQIKEYTLQKDGAYKPTPPGMNIDIIRGKIERRQATSRE